MVRKKPLYVTVSIIPVTVACTAFILAWAEKKCRGGQNCALRAPNFRFCPWGRTDKRGGAENLIIPRERERNV